MSSDFVCILQAGRVVNNTEDRAVKNCQDHLISQATANERILIPDSVMESRGTGSPGWKGREREECWLQALHGVNWTRQCKTDMRQFGREGRTTLTLSLLPWYWEC